MQCNGPGECNNSVIVYVHACLTVLETAELSELQAHFLLFAFISPVSSLLLFSAILCLLLCFLFYDLPNFCIFASFVLKYRIAGHLYLSPFSLRQPPLPRGQTVMPNSQYQGTEIQISLLSCTVALCLPNPSVGFSQHSGN